MIQKEFLQKLLVRLKEGESSLSFKEYMFSNFSFWRNTDAEDIEFLLTEIKNIEPSIYAFILFWYCIFGIDLFALYTEMNNNQWKDENCYKIINGFPSYNRKLWLGDLFLLHQYNISLDDFIVVRKRLVSQGLKKVNQVIFEWGT